MVAFNLNLTLHRSFPKRKMIKVNLITLCKTCLGYTIRGENASPERVIEVDTPVFIAMIIYFLIKQTGSDELSPSCLNNLVCRFISRFFLQFADIFDLKKFISLFSWTYPK